MRRIRSAAALLAMSLAAACGGESTKPTSIVGTWNLTTINAAPLPFVVQDANPKIELILDRFIFSSDATFIEASTLRVTESTGAVSTLPSVDTGRYRVDGTTVTFTFDSDGSVDSATLSGNSILVAANGLTGVYTKQ